MGTKEYNLKIYVGNILPFLTIKRQVLPTISPYVRKATLSMMAVNVYSRGVRGWQEYNRTYTLLKKGTYLFNFRLILKDIIYFYI